MRRRMTGRYGSQEKATNEYWNRTRRNIEKDDRQPNDKESGINRNRN